MKNLGVEDAALMKTVRQQFHNLNQLWIPRLNVALMLMTGKQLHDLHQLFAPLIPIATRRSPSLHQLGIQLVVAVLLLMAEYQARSLNQVVKTLKQQGYLQKRNFTVIIVRSQLHLPV